VRPPTSTASATAASTAGAQQPDASMHDCAAAAASVSASAAAPAPSASSGGPASPAVSSRVSDIRVSKDLAELVEHKFTAHASTRITFPHGRANLRRFLLLVTPHAGLYARASVLFAISIPPAYPFSPPRVRCHTPVLHPCINPRTGHVFLHLLKQDWKPVLTLNAVILALQLLFLEPWPVLSSHAATSSALPPSRPQITSSASGGASSSVLPSVQAQRSALSLVSSQSAAACSLMHLNEDSILNLELLPLIRAGDRATFEEHVRRSLEGGFLFGRQWRRNCAKVHGDDSDDDSEGEDDEQHHHPERDDDDGFSASQPHEESKSPSSFDRLLQRVEAEGRQAHVRTTAREERKEEEMMEDLDGAPRGSPSRLGAAAGSGAPHSGNSGTPRKKRLPLPRHRKRSYWKMSPNEAHEANPAAALVMNVKGAGVCDDDAQLLQMHKRARSTPQAAGSSAPPALTTRVATTSRHRVIRLRKLDFDEAASGAAPAAAQSRKRAQRTVTLGVSSISDGEMEEGEPMRRGSASVAAAAVAPSADVVHVVRTTSDSQRRPKKARAVSSTALHLLPFLSAASAAGGDSAAIDDDDEPTARELEHIHAVHAALGMADVTAGGATGVLSGSPVRPSSTVLPDLASFATLRAEVASVLPSPRPSAAASASPEQREQSGSPKRNVSNAESVSLSAFALGSGAAAASAASASMLDESPFGLAPVRGSSLAESSPSFILAGRSSSRSVNLFGSVKGHVLAGAAAAASGPGLADLQALHASLPVAMCD